MKDERLAGIAAVIATPHVAVASFVFGLRHPGRLLAGT